MSTLARLVTLAPLTAVCLAAQPGVVQAANGLRPRTPAVFSDVPCMTTVEVGTAMQIDYSVPADDTELTPDELTDSRQMQFFALGRLPFDFKLPAYINQDDLDRAEANGDNTKAYGAEDVLRSSSAWPAGSFLAINADDARVPITLEQAAMGLAWDTTGVAPGAWVVAGYTWEPENNLWSFRLGVVRVVDPSDPDAAGPAAFFAADSQGATGEVGAEFSTTACVATASGSTYTASVGVLDGIDEPMWVPFVENAAVEGETVALSPVMPSEAAGKSIKLRLEVTDPNGKTTTTYSPFPVTVLPGAGDGGDTAEGADDDGGGGRCRVAGSAPAPASLLCLLFVGLARRRRGR